MFGAVLQLQVRVTAGEEKLLKCAYRFRSRFLNFANAGSGPHDTAILLAAQVIVGKLHPLESLSIFKFAYPPAQGRHRQHGMGETKVRNERSSSCENEPIEFDVPGR